MPKPDVELSADYKVAKKPVRLSVTIGEGQTGASSVFLGQTQLVMAGDDIGGLLVGSGPDLLEKKLTVRTVVNDVSSLTNRMSVTYFLEGGKADKEFLSKGKASQPGETLFFRAIFSFTS